MYDNTLSTCCSENSRVSGLNATIASPTTSFSIVVYPPGTAIRVPEAKLFVAGLGEPPELPDKQPRVVHDGLAVGMSGFDVGDSLITAPAPEVMLRNGLFVTLGLTLGALVTTGALVFIGDGADVF